MNNFNWQLDHGTDHIYTDGKNWLECTDGHRYTLHLADGSTAAFRADSYQHAGERATAIINAAHVTLTGKEITDSYLGAPRESCKTVDYLTGERATFDLNGERRNAAIIARVRWRANGKHTTLCEYVKADGKQYEIVRA